MTILSSGETTRNESVASRNPVSVYVNTMVGFPGWGGETSATKIADVWFCSSTANAIVSKVRGRKGEMPLTACYNEEKAHNC